MFVFDLVVLFAKIIFHHLLSNFLFPRGLENGRLHYKMGEITFQWEIRISSKSQGICISITEQNFGIVHANFFQVHIGWQQVCEIVLKSSPISCLAAHEDACNVNKLSKNFNFESMNIPFIQ